MQKVWPYLKLGRISNLPTVWANVLCASLLVGGQDITTQALLLTAASLFYTAGMYLNDYFDRAFDKEHRPSRPIPSGDVSERSVLILSTLMTISALAICLSLSVVTFIWAFLVMVFILWYNLDHKLNKLSPFLMAGCRLWLYPMAASAYGVKIGPPLWVTGIAIYAYIVGLSYIARLGLTKSLWSCLALISLLAPVWLRSPNFLDQPALAWAILACLLGWLALTLSPFTKDTEKRVARLLGGIVLIDLYALAFNDRLNLYLLLLFTVFFILNLSLQKRIPGT